MSRVGKACGQKARRQEPCQEAKTIVTDFNQIQISASSRGIVDHFF
jgi:hypothetical protein